MTGLLAPPNTDNNFNFGCSCQGCVFAVMDHTGRTQKNCALGRLEKFNVLGNAEHLLSDENTGVSHYDLDHLCHTFRDTEWLDSKSLRDKSSQEIIRAVYKELEIRYEAVIITKGNSSLNEIETNILEVCRQELPPRHIHVIIYHFHLVKLLIAGKDKFPIPISVEYVVDEPKVDRVIVRISKRINSAYYVVFDCPTQIKYDYVRKISDDMFYDLKKVMVAHYNYSLSNTENEIPIPMWDGLLVYTALRVYTGLLSESLFDRLHSIMREKKCEHLLRQQMFNCRNVE